MILLVLSSPCTHRDDTFKVMMAWRSDATNRTNRVHMHTELPLNRIVCCRRGGRGRWVCIIYEYLWVIAMEVLVKLGLICNEVYLRSILGSKRKCKIIGSQIIETNSRMSQHTQLLWEEPFSYYILHHYVFKRLL